MITRQLNINDFHDVMEMFEERFTTTIEFDLPEFAHLRADPGYDKFKKTFMESKRAIIHDYHLKGGRRFKLFGTFNDELELVSIVEMRIVSETEWVLDNLKSKKRPKTGLKDTLTLLYKTALELNLKEYTFCTAVPKWKLLDRLGTNIIPEYYCEYETVGTSIIPAYSLVNDQLKEGDFGHKIPFVDLITVKRVLKNA